MATSTVSRTLILLYVIYHGSIVSCGMRCPRDVTFIVESDVDLCTNVVHCNYCWGEFFLEFVTPIRDQHELLVQIETIHPGGVVYGAHPDLTKADKCSFLGNFWSYSGLTVSSLLRTVQEGFSSRRSDFSDVIVLVVNSRVGPVDEIARFLHSHRVLVVVVGVGDDVDRSELQVLATDEYSLFLLQDRKDLLKSVSEIRKAVCQSCQKDLTFTFAWNKLSSAAEEWGWCGGGMISQFINPLDNQPQVTSIEWRNDSQSTACQATLPDYSPECVCLRVELPSLTSSVFYDHIIKTFSNLRPQIQNAVVFMTDRKLGFVEPDIEVFRDNNVIMATVGVGELINSRELQTLASFEDVTFFVDHWSNVTQIIPHLRHFVCFGDGIPVDFGDCGDRVDITFIIDLSKSMTGNIQKLKTFLSSFLPIFSITKDQHHITIITFASHVTVLLRDAQELSSVLQVVEQLKPLSGTSNIAGALSEAIYLTQTSNRQLSDSGQYCPDVSIYSPSL